MKYTIFKIRYYADNINVSKGIFPNDNETKLQQYERAKECVRFFWDMVFKLTGKTVTDYKIFYGKEEATKDLFLNHGIIIPEGEEYHYWHIPSDNIELVEWIKTECKLPFKVLKRSPYSHDVLTNICRRYEN